MTESSFPLELKPLPEAAIFQNASISGIVGSIPLAPMTSHNSRASLAGFLPPIRSTMAASMSTPASAVPAWSALGAWGPSFGRMNPFGGCGPEFGGTNPGRGIGPWIASICQRRWMSSAVSAPLRSATQSPVVSSRSKPDMLLVSAMYWPLPASSMSAIAWAYVSSVAYRFSSTPRVLLNQACVGGAHPGGVFGP